MIKVRFSLLLCLFFTLIACGGSGGDGQTGPLEEARPTLDLTFSESPIPLPNIVADFGENIRYGEAERNVFDVYLPDSDEPTPLVIYFHGGGYFSGDKSEAYEYHAEDIREFLQAGIAYATVNYSLLSLEEPYDDDGVIKPLEESTRALQFMRYHFESLNIDPEQIGLYGVSAGASTSLWLATHDELADPDSDDPIVRESSRVNAIAAIYTQATLDIRRWEEILRPVVEPLVPILNLGGTDIPTAATALGAGPFLLTVMGIDSIDELQTPEQIAYLENIDVLDQMDAGDAPIHVFNDTTQFSDPIGLFLHHSLHAIALYERAQEVGLHNVVYAVDPVYALEDPSGEGHVSFLMRHVN